MRHAALVITMLALLASPCASRAGQPGRNFCLVEVLYSEMLTAAPPFYHKVKARLLISPVDRPAYETTAVRVIPWQAPPPRQGQRRWMTCEQASAQYDFHLF